MRYDLNLLPVFLALMEERNVTRAAERLGITQPALSNALARLRTMLRDPLFVRARYGMQPTPQAEALAPVVAEALAQLDGVVLGQQDFDPAKAEQLVTLAPNSYVEFVLVPALAARLRERAPGMRLRLVPYGADLAETGVAATVERAEKLVLNGDPVALRRLVANLADNAVKYGQRVRARVFAEQGAAIIEIDDDGPGVPVGELDRVFDPFYRGEPSRNRETGGIGLGLAVVRSVARAHGGDVTLHNRDGGGLTARVSLPL